MPVRKRKIERERCVYRVHNEVISSGRTDRSIVFDVVHTMNRFKGRRHISQTSLTMHTMYYYNNISTTTGICQRQQLCFDITIPKHIFFFQANFCLEIVDLTPLRYQKDSLIEAHVVSQTLTAVLCFIGLWRPYT